MKKEAKSLKELKKEKLALENQLLTKQLGGKEKETWFDRNLNAPFKKYSPLILTILSIAGGIWGIYFPLNKYFEDQEKSAKFNLSGQILPYVEQLHDSNEAKRESAISMLAYYEKDAVPILVFELGRAKYDNKTIIVNALKTIVALEEQTDRNGIWDFILKRKSVEELIIDNLLNQANNHFTRAYIEGDPLENKFNGMQNYIYALGEFGQLRKVEVHKFFKDQILREIDQHPKLFDLGEDELIKVEIDSATSKLK